MVHGWNEMQMVDLSPELNVADLTNFAKWISAWAFAFEQNGSKFSNKDEACASIETDLPKAFSAVMQDTLQTAKFREFDPKRTSSLKGKGTSQSGWEGYTGTGKGKSTAKEHEQAMAVGISPIGSRASPPSITGMSGARSGKLPGRVSRRRTVIFLIQQQSQGWKRRPWQGAAEWNGAMYTKYTYANGHVEWQAW